MLENGPNVITEKILVGITVQNNSRRLIEKGSELANAKNGQMHILHIQKGDNIFVEANAPELLQELYQYGSELGGETHAICGENICDSIIRFIKNIGITHMILGERSKIVDIDNENEYEGYTDNYVKVIGRAAKNIAGEFHMTKVLECMGDYIIGEVQE